MSSLAQATQKAEAAAVDPFDGTRDRGLLRLASGEPGQVLVPFVTRMFSGLRRKRPLTVVGNQGWFGPVLYTLVALASAAVVALVTWRGGFRW